ncbi:MAG: aldolase/citrate lyase family protein [Hyphomicrobiaceae bacterium]
MAIVKHEPAEFRSRLAKGEVVAGTFIKTPTAHAIEIFGEIGYDFVVIDEEHAPFDRQAIDHGLLAARAGRIAALVRVASASASNILSVLDGGATGVLVPHVASVERAREIANACRYRGGSRGFSNSPRAGRYGGLGMWEHVEAGDSLTTVVAQIEDPEALDHIDAIARVDGIHCLFVGRGDLAVAMGAKSPEAPEVQAATERTCMAAKAAGKPAMVFVGSAADAKSMHNLGATAFIYASDQGLMRRAAAAALRELKAIG